MVRYLVITLLLFFVSCEKSPVDADAWIVVQGVLVEGEYPQVTLRHAVDFESSAMGSPVVGAKVLIYGPNGTVQLTEIEGSSGLYSDTNGEMMIVAGGAYSLSVSKGDVHLSGSTTVPESVGLVQSSATNIPINPNSTGQPIYSVFWTQVEGFTHVLTLDVEEEDPVQIPFSVDSGNFQEQYTFPIPGQGTTIFDTDLFYYGTHRLTIYSIPLAYDAIYFYQNGSGGEQVTEGPDNIEGGSGFFTSASKLEVELEIFEE